MEELNDIRFNQELQDLISKLDDTNKSGLPKEGQGPQTTKGIQTWFFNNFKAFSQPSSKGTVLSIPAPNNLNIAKIIPRTWSQLWANADSDIFPNEVDLFNI